jgi:hypothetical protein
LKKRKRFIEYKFCHMELCLISLTWKYTFLWTAFANCSQYPHPKLTIWKY